MQQQCLKILKMFASLESSAKVGTNALAQCVRTRNERKEPIRFFFLSLSMNPDRITQSKRHIDICQFLGLTVIVFTGLAIYVVHILARLKHREPVLPTCC